MSQKLLVINTEGPETRVALLEQGVLAELYIERHRERGIVGNIYKGKVGRVLPGMQAAFVDIGLDKSAYLHVSDVSGRPEDVRSLWVDEGKGRLIEESDDEDEDGEKKERSGGEGGDRPKRRRRRGRRGGRGRRKDLEATFEIGRAHV